MDAIEVLKRDHRAAEHLFRAYEAAGSADQRRAVVDALINELSTHAAVEEPTIYALAEDLALGSGVDVQGNRAEHMALRRTLTALEQLSAGDERESALVAQLQREVAFHVRDEEANLLPALREAIGPRGLDELARQMAAERAAAPDPGPQPVTGSATEVTLPGASAGILHRLRGRMRAQRR